MKSFKGTGKIVFIDDEEDIRQTTRDVHMRWALRRNSSLMDYGPSICIKKRASEAGTISDALIMELSDPGCTGQDRA